MQFRLKRLEIDDDLLVFCVKKIKQHKIYVPRASKQIVKGMPAILREIGEHGIPNYLLIKKLKGKLGFGVFLHPEAKPILKGDLIGPYSGKVTLSPQNTGHSSDYAFALISDLLLTKAQQHKWDPAHRYHPRRIYSVDLDAEKVGNFTRFINHSEKPNIEAQFVKIPAIGLSPAPFELLYVAKKTIRPGEQLLVCYEGDDKSYWGALNIKPFPMTPRTFLLNKSCNIVTRAG